MLKKFDHRHLLVPQDVRERKGNFYTPQLWVEKAQEYMADTFGENWQEEYFIWDCAAGTGNLLVGLSNKYNIWASTLDKADVVRSYERFSNNFMSDFIQGEENDIVKEAQISFFRDGNFYGGDSLRSPSELKKRIFSEDTKSDNPAYNELIGVLRDKLKILAKKIEPKVYEYGFLLQ
ncbi:MAG: hypothetical protein LBR13_03455 [Dysgonamonadaceae bacterium]|jgi:hypothetical protein|nr:hypothetical protein [Dysgonamonadaceae bacterium]